MPFIRFNYCCKMYYSTIHLELALGSYNANDIEFAIWNRFLYIEYDGKVGLDVPVLDISLVWCT